VVRLSTIMQSIVDEEGGGQEKDTVLFQRVDRVLNVKDIVFMPMVIDDFDQTVGRAITASLSFSNDLVTSGDIELAAAAFATTKHSGTAVKLLLDLV